MIKFARISLKTPNGPIVLNFADNPAAIKPARVAIQNMAENVNPQQDGILLYVPIPKITRGKDSISIEKVFCYNPLSKNGLYKLKINKINFREKGGACEKFDKFNFQWVQIGIEWGV